MVMRHWTFKVDNSDHMVEIDHSWLTGKRTIYLDNKPVAEGSKLLDLMSDYGFKVGGHEGLLTIRSNGFTYNYDFGIDGRSVKTGGPVARAEKMPAWAWVFVFICVVIPIVTLGGAIPAAIGGTGAIVCSIFARDATKHRTTRVMWCAGVTILCWITLLALILILSGGRTPVFWGNR